MKRGLVRPVDSDEAVAELAQRLEAFRHALRERNVQVGLVYGDVETAQPLTFLTNVCVYWGHALLLVPADADVVLLTSSSKRVHPWIRTSSVIEEIHATPDLGRVAGEQLANVGCQRAGLIDRSFWPSEVLEKLSLAAPNVPLDDLGPLARRMQLVPSDRQRSALTQAARLCHEGFAAFRDHRGDTASRIGAAEYAMRIGGAADVQVSAHPAGASDARWAGIKTHIGSEWSMVQGFAPPPPGDGDPMRVHIERGFAAWLQGLRPGMGLGEAESGAATALEAENGALGQVRGRLLAHADIETDAVFGSSIGTGQLPEGAVVGASIDVRTRDDRLIRIGDTVSIGARGADPLNGTSS